MSDQTETVYPDVETATRALTSDADYSRAIGQPADAGGNYTEMLPANPLPKEDFGEQTFEGKEGIKRAAEEVAARRLPTRDELQAKEPVEVSYRAQYDGKAGETIKPSHEVVTAEQAAFDLQNFREGLRAQEQAAADELLRHEVDAARGQQTTEALGVQEPVALDQQQQAQTQQQPQNQDEALSRALSDPAVLTAVQQHVAQATAHTNQIAQQYVSALQNNANAAYASLFSAYPELRNVPPNQLNGALAVIQQKDPARHAEIMNHVRVVQEFTNQARQAEHNQQVAYQHQAQQMFNSFAEGEDTKFDKYMASQVAPDQRRRVEEEAWAIMRETGLSDQEIGHRWATDPLLRSFHGQKILMEAAQWRLARKAAVAKRDRTAPAVQVPGIGEKLPASDYAMHSLNKALNSATDRKSQLKAAAALVAARRRG